MKKIIISLFVILSLAVPASVFAWDDCPHGLVNDAYPGDCNKYIDTDGDGICDHSQSAPEDREVTTAVTTETEEVDTTTTITTTTQDDQEVAAAQESFLKSDSGKLLFSFGIAIVGLLIILGYVQYKKRNN